MLRFVGIVGNVWFQHDLGFHKKKLPHRTVKVTNSTVFTGFGVFKA